MTEKTGIIITASGRTLDEVKAEIRIRMRNMVNNALDIGIELMEAKEACKHGEWMPFLKEIGLSSSTAANYMRIAKEVGADSKMARLPYTKILALLAAPPEEREELATAAEDMSAAEIRRLTEERNRAAEAANTETARADHAEEDAKRFYDENAGLRTKIQDLQIALDREMQQRKMAEADVERITRQSKSEIKEKQKEIENVCAENIDLRGKLVYAENHKVEVEVFPDDYEELKRQKQELIEAAAEAEERAAQAEAELEEARSENARNGISDYEKLHMAMKTFLMQCELMACNPVGLIPDREKAKKDIERIQQWCEVVSDALSVVPVKAVVV